jgi:hypothetical protein
MTMTTTLPNFVNPHSPGKQGTSILYSLLRNTPNHHRMGSHKGTADWEGSCQETLPVSVTGKAGKRNILGQGADTV